MSTSRLTLTSSARIGIAGLAGAALLLTGCGGSQTPTTSPSEAPASSAPSSSAPSSSAPSSAPSSSAASETPSSAPSTETTETASSVKDPCKVIDLDAMAKLSGFKLKSLKSTSQTGSKICTYVPSELGVVPIITGEGALIGSLKAQVSELQKVTNGAKASDVDVAGADEATTLSGKNSGFNQVFVLAGKGNVFYLASLAGKEDPSGYEKKSVKIVEALIKG